MAPPPLPMLSPSREGGCWGSRQHRSLVPVRGRRGSPGSQVLSLCGRDSCTSRAVSAIIKSVLFGCSERVFKAEKSFQRGSRAGRQAPVKGPLKPPHAKQAPLEGVSQKALLSTSSMETEQGPSEKEGPDPEWVRQQAPEWKIRYLRRGGS